MKIHLDLSCVEFENTPLLAKCDTNELKQEYMNLILSRPDDIDEALYFTDFTDTQAFLNYLKHHKLVIVLAYLDFTLSSMTPTEFAKTSREIFYLATTLRQKVLDFNQSKEYYETFLDTKIMSQKWQREDNWNKIKLKIRLNFKDLHHSEKTIKELTKLAFPHP
jgi:hypothetical protein